MNILPKKSWHVRKKENIARVRRDEAKLAAEEKEQQRRAQLAEGEARNAALRAKAKSLSGSKDITKYENVTETTQQKHVNFFEDLEQDQIVSNASNAEHEQEKKEEREKYEKQIGYLTYLGQDTVEATGKISWYNKVPIRGSSDAESSNAVSNKDRKLLGDPLNDIRRYLGFDELKIVTKKKKIEDEEDSKQKKRKKKERNNEVYNYKGSSRKQMKAHKKKKKDKHRHKNKRQESSSSSNSCSSSDSDDKEPSSKVSATKLEELRTQRIKREQAERKRTEALLAKISGEPDPEAAKVHVAPAITQRYNSQFNPHLARQNMN